MNNTGYRNAFFAAIGLHLFLGIMLFAESSSTHPVLINDNKNEAGEMTSLDTANKPQPDIVKATTIDNQEVAATVNRLKQERAKQIKAEQARQQALNKQAENARKERIIEQQKLAKLKEDAAKMAIARKKQLDDEQKHLKELAIQKQQEIKHLEELKKQQKALEKKQQDDIKKLAELKKKQLLDDANRAKDAIAAKEKTDQANKLAKAKADALAAEQAQEAKEQAAKADAENALKAAQRAKMAGQVDKYKAMIVGAIGDRWILPDKVAPGLSSQFRIVLAPDGSVLKVSLLRSSGDSILDRSAQAAIFKASPLPVPADPVTFELFRDISLTVRPESVRG